MEFYLLSELNKPKDEESEEKVDYDEYLWENAYDIDIEREKPAIVKFIPRSLLLEPGEKGVVEVHCEAKHPYTHTDIAKIKIKDGKDQFVNVKAEIQDIHVSLNTYSLDFDCLFAGNTYNFQKGKDE